MTGLELFRKRAQKLELDDSKIFEKYGIRLPPLAKDFLAEHELEMSLAESSHFYHKAILNHGDITFPFSSIKVMLQSTIGMNDIEVTSKGLLLFATNQHGIFIGSSGEWRDKILTRTWSLDNSYMVVASDIKEFLENTHSRLIDITNDEDEFISHLRQLGWDEEDIGYELEDFRAFQQS